MCQLPNPFKFSLVPTVGYDKTMYIVDKGKDEKR